MTRRHRHHHRERYLTITINGTNYTYTVHSDTLTTIVQGLVKTINSAPDPNVIATANVSNLEVDLTARMPGANGGNITLAATVSSTATETLRRAAPRSISILRTLRRLLRARSFISPDKTFAITHHGQLRHPSGYFRSA